MILAARALLRRPLQETARQGAGVTKKSERTPAPGRCQRIQKGLSVNGRCARLSHPSCHCAGKYCFSSGGNSSLYRSTSSCRIPSNASDSWKLPWIPSILPFCSSIPINASKFFPSAVVIPKWSQVRKPILG